MSCLFCNIINNKIPCKKLYENDFLIAFEDINPQAPVHILIVPKKHIDTILNFSNEDATLIKQIFSAAKELATELKLVEKGFRIVINTGIDAGQTINHVHFHLLGQRIFSWPPG